MADNQEREITIRYLTTIPSVQRIMRTKIPLEQKRIVADNLQLYEEERERDMDQDALDAMMNNTKILIYAFAVNNGHSDRDTRKIGLIPRAFDIVRNLCECVVPLSLSHNDQY